MSAGLILLAAGGSARLGRPKQLLPYQGSTLLRNAAQMALSSCCHPVVIVLGAEADACRKELADLSVQITLNDQWARGMGGSIAAGVAALEKSGVDAAVIMLCDQPGVTAEHIDLLVQTFRASGALIVASEYGGSAGVPALFARSLFPELTSLNLSHGAKPVIARHAGRVATVPFSAAAIDIDTPADYERLLG